MSRRRLRPDELDLWQKVARTAERLQPAKPASPVPFTKQQQTRPTPPKPAFEKFDLGTGSREKPVQHDVLPGLSEQIAAAPVRMDSKAFARLKRGKLRPEGRIDLHGMTLDQARPALNAFITSSYARQRRLVLVITGKGKRAADEGPIPTRPGVLRHNVPRWLQAPPLSHMVLQISEAHVRHGGAGAYYVYLRRKR